MAKYYDIDDILAEEEIVPAVFRKAAVGVMQIDSGEDSDKVEVGSKVELPYWLASELHPRNIVSISIPSCYERKSRTREEIGADPAHVDLRSRCLYFYEFGSKIARLVGDKTIGPLLLVAFRARYKDVLIKALTSALAVPPKFLSILTKEETKLYEAGQSSTAAFKKWRIGGPRLQRASLLGKKRKSIE